METQSKKNVTALCNLSRRWCVLLIGLGLFVMSDLPQLNASRAARDQLATPAFDAAWRAGISLTDEPPQPTQSDLVALSCTTAWEPKRL